MTFFVDPASGGGTYAYGPGESPGSQGLAAVNASFPALFAVGGLGLFLRHRRSRMRACADA
jgi:hypothetical protein